MSNSENEKQKMLQSFKTADESGYVALGQYIPVRRHTARYDEKNIFNAINYTVPITLPEEPKFNLYEGDYASSSPKDKKEVRKQIFKSIFRVLQSLFLNFPYTGNKLLGSSKIKEILSKSDSVNENINQFA